MHLWIKHPPAHLARLGLAVGAAGIAFGVVVLVAYAFTRNDLKRMALAGASPEPVDPGPDFAYDAASAYPSAAADWAYAGPGAAEPAGAGYPAGTQVLDPAGAHAPGGVTDAPRGRATAGGRDFPAYQNVPGRPDGAGGPGPAPGPRGAAAAAPPGGTWTAPPGRPGPGRPSGAAPRAGAYPPGY